MTSSEEALARLSILQELTAAALVLFGPEQPVDLFLERCTERLGCVAGVWLSFTAGGVSLLGAAGISSASRQLTLPRSSRSPPWQDVALPFPEVMGTGMVHWAFELTSSGSLTREVMMLFFDAPRVPASYRPMMERLARILQTAVDHRRAIADLRRSYEELARTQRALVEKERLAALGELSAVVAHEVRNPLGVIFNALAALRKGPAAATGAGSVLDVVSEEADRLNKMVNDLLDFARPDELITKEEHLQEIVGQALAAARAGQKMPPALNLKMLVEPASLAIALDARLIRQALINLVSNAVQVMPRGGTISVRARRRAPHGVSIEVTDDGPGISPASLTRVFEPFFTTKAQGTGLGLAIVKRIVQAHQGEVSVESQPGVGTTFTVSLPG